MALIYRTAGPWGAGALAPLAAADVDNNFWDHEQRLDTIEGTPPTAVSIASIAVVAGGTAIEITLTNGVIQGPFILPVAALTFRDGWTNGLTLTKNTILSVAGVGIFLVLKTHVTPIAPAVFDPLYVAAGEPAYHKMFGLPALADYELDLNYLGVIPGGEAKLLIKLVRRAMTFAVDLPDSVFRLDVATTAALVLKLFKNAAEIGTVTFAAAGQVGVVSLPLAISFVPGDRLYIKGPVTADATAADFAAAIIAQAG